TYGSVVYRQVYPGIDLRFHGNRSQLEYDFVVAAGADAGLIRLSFSGAKKMTVNADGDLDIRLDGGCSGAATAASKRPLSWARTIPAALWLSTPSSPFPRTSEAAPRGEVTSPTL